MSEHGGIVTTLAEIRPRLGSLLVRRGLLSPEQLEDCLEERATTGRRLGEILLRRGWVGEVDIAQALAEQYGLSFVDPTKVEIEPAAAALLPERFATERVVLPIRLLDERRVLVAVADPTDLAAFDELELVIGLAVTPVVAARSAIEAARARLAVPADEFAVREGGGRRSAAIDEESEIGGSAAEVVNEILRRAIELGASDLHFEPRAVGMIVRARVDGVLRRIDSVSGERRAAVVSRLKVMAELDIAERRLPQDGRVAVTLASTQLDLRIAVLPTPHGEAVVLRILYLRGRRASADLAELGMSTEIETAFRRAVLEPSGAIIACGPTGSGKTTTLYAALSLLEDEERAIVTIEDPIEHRLDRAVQVEVNPRAGLTFARGLRTILRADPDVILVGEIRDEETARIALQAALTGHLVLTTLHAEDAAGAIARLRDMGLAPLELAVALEAIVGQRLVRRLCVECRVPYETSARLEGFETVSGEITLYRAGGCSACANTGYAGRIAVYEVLELDESVRAAVRRGDGDLAGAAVGAGMRKLRSEAERLCLAGVTSVDEVRRVCGRRAF